MRTQEEYTQEIARQCGKLLPTDDPLMLLHTFLSMYGEDLSLLQQQLLQGMASTSEESITQWNTEVTIKANRIITATLEAAKKASAAQFDEQANALKKSISGLLEAHTVQAQSLYQKTYYIAVANMIAAGLLAITAMFFFLK